jgi:hypothetical protein
VQVRTARPGRGLDLLARRAALPVVGQIEDCLEAALGHQRGHRREVAPIRLQVVHLASERVSGAAMQHRDVVTARDEAPHDLAAHEDRAADDHNLHR